MTTKPQTANRRLPHTQPAVMTQRLKTRIMIRWLKENPQVIPVKSPFRVRQTVRKCKTALLVLLAGIFIHFTAQASQNATLSWQPSADPTVVGYDIYYGGASGDYTNMISVGNVSSVVIPGLMDGTTYYFAATSRDAQGDESGFSAEAVYTTAKFATLLMKSSVLNGVPQIVISAAGAVPTRWVLEASSDLKNWSMVSHGSQVVSNVAVPVNKQVPAQFFRLRSQ